MSRNQLDQETSPYLLQHRDNPVHWWPWGPAALEAARSTNKPILLSVGYAACHWCHVMAHESFEDDTTAQLINELYIPIKVDREERPDLDMIYQSALAMLGQQGGWPLTMFLTPDGEPFWGGTYFPPTPRFGRPSFRDVLVGVAATYDGEMDKVAANVSALKEGLLRHARAESGTAPAIEDLDHAARSQLRVLDPAEGGLSGAPKFPQVPLFELLWRAALRTGDARLREVVILTLDRMSHGGIYDHLGGGYARYSTDERWLVPHFEKMLYDNAQMIDLLTVVWQDTRTPLYAERVAETIGWVRREMLAEHDAFAATLDADSEGEEGKYYVWRADEIERLLPAGLVEPFKEAYDVTPAGNWEGVSILNRNHPQPRSGPGFEEQLAEARAILLQARQARVAPGRDDKILADWNGMMIAAIARAAFVFEQPDWLAMAERAFAAIRGHCCRGGRLAHSLRHGRLQAEAMLDDYAEMARAAIALFEATGRNDYLEQAADWVAVLDRHYWDDEAGGYFFTADDSADLIVRSKTAQDHATPSGNGVMVEVLARLYHLTGNEAYRQRAEQIVTAFAGDLQRGFPSMATLLNGWELLSTAVQVVIAGKPDDPRSRQLLRSVARVSLPNLVLTVVDADRSLPAGHPAFGKTSLANGLPAAYVCRGPVCSPPLSDPDQLHAALAAR